MKEINEYKALIEDVSRVISSYANYKLWPPEIMREWNENTLLELHKRVLRFNPADVKEAIIGDGKIDEFAGRLKTAKFELDNTPPFAPTNFDDDYFCKEKNPAMFDALKAINGKGWAFNTMERLRMIAFTSNLIIDDIHQIFDEIDVFVNGKTTRATPEQGVNKTELSKYFNAKFKGSGNNPNYFDTLIEDIKDLRTSKDLAIVALMIYNCPSFIQRPSTFAAWLREFFEIIGRDYPKDQSKNKYKPSEKIQRMFYYLA